MLSFMAWRKGLRGNTTPIGKQSRWRRPWNGPARLWVEQLENRTLLSVSVLSSFKGLSTFDAGGIIEPPDTIAAAGPTTVVEVVNSNIAFFDKTTGQSLSSQPLDQFFAPVDSVDFLLSDVYVAYDEQVGRFFVSTMDIDFTNMQSYFDFAISNDSDPRHGFTEMHQINTTELSPQTLEPLFTDFPRVGWNADAYFVSFNMFGFQTQNPYNTQLLTIKKSSVTDLNNATLTTFDVDRPAPNSTLAPATMHGATAGGPMWFVEEKGLEQNGAYQYLRVVKETNVLSATPTFTDYYVPIAAYNITPFPSDPNAQITTALDTRILSVDWRGGTMVVAQNVGIASDVDVHARWYQISTSTSAPSMIQQGTIAPADGVDTYMPSAALAPNGSIGMTYIESSATENMSMYVVGRVAADLLGTMETPLLVKAGEQSYQGTRAGDFSSVMVDPTTGSSFWAANEYAITDTNIADPNWGTWIANFQVVNSHATRTWTGGGSTANWSDRNNWSGGVAPNPGDNLVFGPGASRLASNNDFAPGTYFNSIAFTGAGYTITGNSITLNGPFDGSAATGNNSFSPNLALAAAETINAGSGSTTLTLSGTLNNGGFALTLAGGSGSVNFTNTLSGSGSFTETNTGLVTFSGPSNTYTGTTTVQKGTLVLADRAGNAIAGSLVIGPNAGVVRLGGNNQIAASASITVNSAALLDFNNHSNTIGNLTLTSGTVTTGTGTWTLNGSVTDSGASNITGNLALGSSNRTFTVNSGGILTVSAIISGTGSLTKSGPGTLVLSANNTYTGATTISAGTLQINGSQPNSPITIKSGGTLAGDGTTGAVTALSGGIVSPGLATGLAAILSTENLILPTGATLKADWNGTTAGTSYDQIDVTGSVNLTGSTLSLTLGYTPAINDSMILIDNDGTGPIIGTFNGLAQNARFLLNGMTFQINYQGGDGNDVVITRIA
jgi:autotransporter-associated beta strand protein